MSTPLVRAVPVVMGSSTVSQKTNDKTNDVTKVWGCKATYKMLLTLCLFRLLFLRWACLSKDLALLVAVAAAAGVGAAL